MLLSITMQKSITREFNAEKLLFHNYSQEIYVPDYRVSTLTTYFITKANF